MLNCWQFNPQKRCQFPELVQKLDKLLSLATDKASQFSRSARPADIFFCSAEGFQKKKEKTLDSFAVVYPGLPVSGRA